MFEITILPNACDQSEITYKRERIALYHYLQSCHAYRF